MFQHAAALANGQADARAMLDRSAENCARLVNYCQYRARARRANRPPLLDLGEIAVVAWERVVGFFLGRRSWAAVVISVALAIKASRRRV